MRVRCAETCKYLRKLITQLWHIGDKQIAMSAYPEDERESPRRRTTVWICVFRLHKFVLPDNKKPTSGHGTNRCRIKIVTQVISMGVGLVKEQRAIGTSCKRCKVIRHRSVMLDHSFTTSSATVEPTHDDLPALPLWTFALGVLAPLTFGLTSVPAIICGHRALGELRPPNHASLARSVAVTGLVIGYVGAVLLGTWIVILTRFLITR